MIAIDDTTIRYISISIGYAMWTPKNTKLELAIELLEKIIPMLKDKQVILCFDSWYAKKKLIDWALSYNNVSIICKAIHDTAKNSVIIMEFLVDMGWNQGYAA